MRKKPLIVVMMAALAAATLLAAWFVCSQPKIGSRYVYINACNFAPDPWREKPVPYVEIITILEIKDGHARCTVAGTRADGVAWYREDIVTMRGLGCSKRISR